MLRDDDDKGAPSGAPLSVPHLPRRGFYSAGQRTPVSAALSSLWKTPFHGPGNAAGVSLTTSQLPGNEAPGSKTSRHSPVAGFVIASGNAGAANTSDTAKHANAVTFRIFIASFSYVQWDSFHYTV